MAGGLNLKAAVVVTVPGWLLSPVITLFLPKILARLGFDASKELQKLEIHTIPELKRTLQAVDQERMMQRGERENTHLEALDKMAAMLRHALEDAEDILDDAQHKIVLRCWHRLCGASATCIALCKSSCFWIARIVRTKSDWILQWARNSSSSLFLVRRSEEPVPANISAAAAVSDEPVAVTIDIPASDDETIPVTTGAAACEDETVPVTTGAVASGDENVPVTTTGAAVSGEPDPVTTGDEIVPVTTGAEASDHEPDPITTSVEASNDQPDPVTAPSDSFGRRLISCLWSSFDFLKNCRTSLYNWSVHVFEAAGFYTDWSYEVVGIKKCQENATFLDIFLTAFSRWKLKKRIQKVENTVGVVKKSTLLGVVSNSAPNDVANKNRRCLGAASKRKVFGREVLRDDIMAKLRDTTPQGDAPSSSPAYSVIGIYGVTGSGKTTFAGYVRDYIKEECTEKLFDTIMCIRVSETFSVDAIFHEMLKDITGDRHDNISDHEELAKKLKEALRGKRFFLILDDLWVKNKNDQQLEELISPLNVGSKGSKILVTARTIDAAGALCGDELIEMPDLDKDQYLKMFMHYALGGGTSVDFNEFERVGRLVANKLHRSPIAAVTVAGRLGKNRHMSFWKNTANHEMFNETNDALWWSYQQLNPDIRRCFEFCNICPRRFKLRKDKLVRLWIAQGFVKTSCATEEMEEVAEGYIQELVSCSFLHPEFTDCFTIHDLLHDLLDKISGNDYYRIENERSQTGEGWKGDVPRDVRHLFVQNYDAELITEKILGLENLRTLIIYDAGRGPVEEKVIESICMRLGKLRVLAIAEVFNESAERIRNPDDKFLVPESIIQLKHLRYLAIHISSACAVILPSTLAKLHHIQLLDFDGGKILEFTFVDLINLRHIFCLCKNFPNVGRLSSLRTLPCFTVRNEQGYELKQLRDLNKLSGKLWICGLVNVESKDEALEANLAAKEWLTELTLEWGYRPAVSEVEAEVLEGLCPPAGLQTLCIENYRGSRYPGWMVGKQNGGPKDLKNLYFSMCKQQLGRGPELKAFPHLQVLDLFCCDWATLPGTMEHLTSLKELCIVLCPNIKLLPTLPQSLEVIELDECNPELTRSCKTEGEPNWVMKKTINVDIEESIC